ncbi:TolB family protein [Billgrantia sp. LNSP4103-1]|uniref:TolB family protein n=1 Tax=Billgrantia sp. LNSP4103-1 TaxID=3410266 RepID=UPI00403FB4FF
MTEFNNVERAGARLLARFPLVKKIAKFSYTRLVYLRAKKNYTHQVKSPIVMYCTDAQENFFGYYDKSPINSKGIVLVCTVQGSTKEKPAADAAIKLAVITGKNNILTIPVQAYNWQQGCRAHWLNDDEFIFNDFDEDEKCYAARIFSVSKEAEVKRYLLAVQDSFKDEYFISLNYQRLMALRPDYGYRNLPSLDAKQLADLSNDGLWYVDINTGESRLLVSIQQACELSPLKDFAGAQHKFNHVLISPNGEQLVFMHRFLQGQRRSDRLILLDIASGELQLLADFGMVSHCFWADDSTILGYMRGPEYIDAYWLVDTGSKEFSRLPGNALHGYGDGHPHVHGDWFVTDTYPDKARMQHLFLCNWKTGEVKQLGEFFHGFDYTGESRCDLHPRFSRDGQKVFFDTVFSGKRQLCSMDLEL